ncbi:hypothetical protein [Streptomyces sp. NPDC002067]
MTDSLSDDELFDSVRELGAALNRRHDPSMSDSDREANKIIADVTAARLAAGQREENS